MRLRSIILGLGIVFLMAGLSACGESNMDGSGVGESSPFSNSLSPSSDEGNTIPITIAKSIVPEIDEDYVEVEYTEDEDDFLTITCDECVDLTDADNEDLIALVTNTETGEEIAVDIDETGSFVLRITGTLEEDVEMHVENSDGDKSKNVVVVTMLEPNLLQIDTVKLANSPVVAPSLKSPVKQPESFKQPNPKLVSQGIGNNFPIVHKGNNQ